MRWLVCYVLACSLTLVFSVGTVNAEQQRGKSVCVALPIEVNDDIIPSGFFAEVTEHEYLKPASLAFKDAAESSPEAAISRLLSAIASNDLAAFKLQSVDDESGSAANTLRLYRQIMAATADPQARIDFELGGARYFVFDLKSTEVPGIAFVLVQTPTGWKHSFNLLQHPICQEFSLLCQAMQIHPEAYRPVVMPANPITIAVPSITGKAEDGINLVFRGCGIDYDPKAPAEKADPSRPPDCSENGWAAAKTYSAIYAALASGSSDAYLSHFDDSSRAKIAKVIQARPDGFDGFRQAMMMFMPPVNFIVDGDKLSTLICLDRPQNSQPTGTMFHSMLKASDGSTHEVNVSVETELGSLLKVPKVSEALQEALLHIKHR